jgi:hypothetical protein
VKKFVQEDAWAIQKKLKAEVDNSSKHHTQIKFWHEGILVIQFGIRRVSAELGHGHLPKDMMLSQKDCRTFRQCSMYLQDYIQILKSKGIIA